MTRDETAEHIRQANQLLKMAYSQGLSAATGSGADALRELVEHAITLTASAFHALQGASFMDKDGKWLPPIK